MQRSGAVNGPKGQTGTDCNAIDWRKADRIVSNLRHRIFRSGLLEPCEVQISSTVLRGGSLGNEAPLPGSRTAYS